MEAIDKKESLELYSMLIGYRKEAESFMPPPLKLTPLKPPDSEEKVISNKPRLKDYTAKANSFLPTKAAEDAFYAGYIDEMDKTSGMLSTGIKTISGIGSKIMGSKIGLGATELMKSPAVQKMKPIATKAITGATVLGGANTALSHGNTFKPMSMPSMPKMPSMPGMPKLAEEALYYGYCEETAEMQKESALGMKTIGSGLKSIGKFMSPAKTLPKSLSPAVGSAEKYIGSGAGKIRTDRFFPKSKGRTYTPSKVNINNSEVPIKSVPKPVAPAPAPAPAPRPEMQGVKGPAEKPRDIGSILSDRNVGTGSVSGFTPRAQTTLRPGDATRRVKEIANRPVVRKDMGFVDDLPGVADNSRQLQWRPRAERGSMNIKGSVPKPVAPAPEIIKSPINQVRQVGRISADTPSNFNALDNKITSGNLRRNQSFSNPNSGRSTTKAYKEWQNSLGNTNAPVTPSAKVPTTPVEVVQDMGKTPGAATKGTNATKPIISPEDQKILNEQKARIETERSTRKPGVTEVETPESPVEKVKSFWGKNKKTNVTEPTAPVTKETVAPATTSAPVTPSAEVPTTPVPATEEVAKAPGRWGTRMKWGLGGLTVGGLGAGILTQGNDKKPNQTYYG